MIQTEAGRREYRTQTFHITHREDAMIIVAQLVRAGFDFEVHEGNYAVQIRPRTHEGEKHTRLLMRQNILSR